MKKILIVLLAAICVLSCVCLTACDYKTKIGNYVFTIGDGSVVNEDFVLDGIVYGAKVKWESSNEHVVKLEKKSYTDIDDDGNKKKEIKYTATVTRPAEDTEVKLTMTMGTQKREFSVWVTAVDVNDIMADFVFKQEMTTVTDDFTLAQSHTYKQDDAAEKDKYSDKTATITWTVEDEESKNYVKIENNNKCVVTNNNLDPQVRIVGTFKYGTQVQHKEFTFNVTTKKEHREQVNYWYNNTGVSQDMEGYVVAIAQPYNIQYGSVTFYMMDEDMCCGYYIYGANCDEATGNKIAPGVYVKVTDSINTVFNGLYETNSGCKVVVDDGKDPIDVKEHIYAMDDEIIGMLPSAKTHQSMLVSLTNWEIVDVSSKAPSEGKNTTIITIQKEGRKVTVATSKYLEGVYTTEIGDPIFDGFDTKRQELKVGQYVTVTGILGYYRYATESDDAITGHQVMPLSADDIVVTQADEAGTQYVGNKVASMIANIEKALKEANVNTVVTGKIETIVKLPASTNDVTVTYQILGGAAISWLNEADRELRIKPGHHDQGRIEATITCGTFTTRYYFTIEYTNESAQKMLKAEYDRLFVANITGSDLALQTIGLSYSNVVINWDIIDYNGLDASPYGLTINNNVISIAKRPDKDTQIELMATISCTVDGVEETKIKDKIYITVKRNNVIAVDTDNLEDGEYKLAIDQNNKKQQLYIVNQVVNTYYLGSVTKLDESDNVFVKNVDGGFYLYFLVDGQEQYLNAVPNDSHVNLYSQAKAVNEEPTVWKIGEKGGVKYIYATVNEKDYMIGTNGTYTTFTLREASSLGKSGEFAAYLALPNK